MKNIIIAGPIRAGKSTLARKINEELNYFVINLDKLVAVFQGAYPQLNIKLNWNRRKTTDNLAPFLGHYLGMFSSADGHGLLPYSHGAVKGNRFVLEGAYFDFEKISSILKTYGIEEFKDNFLLIGLVQNKKRLMSSLATSKNTIRKTIGHIILMMMSLGKFQKTLSHSVGL